jgi:hypothetical protein
MQLRGVGAIIATAMLATVGDARQFRSGRQMSASLGLTPKQHSVECRLWISFGASFIKILAATPNALVPSM